MNARFIYFFLAFIGSTLTQARELSEEKNDFPFVPNLGQWPQEVKYRMDFDHSSIFFEQNAIHYQIVKAPSHSHFDQGHSEDQNFQAHIFRIEFEGSNLNGTIEGKSPSSSYYNYFLGNKPSKWRSGVHPYGEIRYRNLYPKIDLKYYTQSAQLKYDLILKPGADPAAIRFHVLGADKVQLKKEQLYIKYRFGELVEMKPYAYQIINGKKVAVACEFVLQNDDSFGFQIGGEYQIDLPLIIDPAVVFSTYSGSATNNFGMTATYDGAGNGYMGGTVFTNAYNNTSRGFQSIYGLGDSDMALSKFSADGSRLIYSTFLGGTGTETAHSMVVNSRQELIVMGVSSSLDYPLSANASQQVKVNSRDVNMPLGYNIDFLTGADIVLSKISPDGRFLRSSTYFGGDEADGLNFQPFNSTSLNRSLVFNYGDHFRGEVNIGPGDTIYLGTSVHSGDLDTTFGAFGGAQDGVIAKFSPNLDSLIWSRYFGGSGMDAIYSLKITNRNQILVGGGTRSFSDFPITNGVTQPVSNGGRAEGFVSLFSSSGALLHSTYMGTSEYDQIYFIESDRDNGLYALGQTSSETFPIQNSLIADTAAGQFIVKFDSTLSQIEFAHTFGNGNVATGNRSNINISPTAFLVDRCKNIYVSGWGGSLTDNNGNPTDGQKTMVNNMPLSQNAEDRITDGNDFYLYVVNNLLDSVIYGSYLGGGLSDDHVDGGTSRFSKNGIIFQSVCASCLTTASDFPTTTSSAFPNKSNAPICNNALYKYDFEILPIASFSTDTSSFCIGPNDSVLVQVTDRSARANRINWDFYGTIVPGGFQDTTVVINSPGIYTITQIVEDTLCATDAFETQTIEAFPDDILLDPVDDTLICYQDSLVLNANDNGNANRFDWSKDPFFGTLIATTNIPLYKVGLQAGIDTFYVRAGNDITNACEKIDTLVVEYLPVAYQANVSNDTICENSEVQFAASINNIDTYVWDYANGRRDTSILNASVTYPAAGSYEIEFIVNNARCATNDTIILPLEVVTNDISINAIPDTLACRTDSISLFQSAGGTVQNFLWSSDSTYTDTLNNYPSDNQLIINQAGLDTFYVKVSNDYCQRTDAVEVEIVPFELELSEFPDSVCTPFSQAVSTLIIGADSFRINYGIGQSTSTNPTPTANYNLQGSYTIQLIGYNNQCNIADTLEEAIEVLRGVELAAINDTVICIGDSIDLRMAHNQSAVEFIWSTDPTFTNPLNSITDSIISVSPSDSTRYYYRAINGICDADTSVEVGTNDLEIDLVDFSSICIEDTVSLVANPNSNFPPYVYNWSPASEILTGLGSGIVEVAPLVDSRYFITVTDNLQCEDTASSLVEVNIPRFESVQLSSSEDTIFKGQSVQLSQSRTESDLFFRWEPAQFLNDPFSANPRASPPSNTTFTLTITDQQTGCEVVSSISVNVLEINCADPNIFVPNAFTPNNDGNNDILFVRGEVMTEIELSIYNRWGELIFETNDQDRGWDGTLGGRKVDPGVFVYHLKARCFDGQEYFEKGNVSLIR